ncbi:MAG TPA: HEAT repeat domain-containing protein [Bryobacteraceae bacterium]|nr:HEAT repeat domain-containing protein [Bryobacteraceae bacterium]
MTRLIYSRNWPRIARLLVVLILICYIAAVVVVAQWLDDLSDPFVQYTSAFVLVQFSVLTAIGLLLIVGKLMRVKWEWRRASRVRKLEELLAAADAEAAALEAARRWPEEFLTVVNSTLQSIRGSERKRVIRLLEASALYPSLLKQTLSRNPDRAIRAITLLGQLDTPEARAAVARGLQHPAETIRQAARKAIMQGNDPAAQRKLLDEFPRLPAWQRLIIFHFAPSEAALLPQFVAEALQSEDENRILIALELVLTRQRFLPCVLPLRLARAENAEVRIKFFKALRFLRLEADVMKALQLGLGDADWRVRAMAAQACGQFRAAALAERLLGMCRTFENPAEAAHAARALAALGGEGWLRLQEVANSETDQARQIATEAVERHMLGGAA